GPSLWAGSTFWRRAGLALLSSGATGACRCGLPFLAFLPAGLPVAGGLGRPAPPWAAGRPERWPAAGAPRLPPAPKPPRSSSPQDGAPSRRGPPRWAARAPREVPAVRLTPPRAGWAPCLLRSG